jgi:hypothetical protein
VKVIGLVPVRNEAWVLEHSLASLSGFCDVIIVSDQHSSDDSRDICRRFPRVVLLDPEANDMAGRLPQKARWRLLDAARSYDGHNVLWCTDADELTPPATARGFFSREAGRLSPGVAIACRYYHLWESTSRFRDDLSIYGPQFKVVACLDDRRVDFRRSGVPPLDEPRTPFDTSETVLEAPDVPVLHLQWTIRRRNQLKQAWYRCVDLISTGRPAVRINEHYARTLPEWYVHTAPVPPGWLANVTLPDTSVDNEPSWHAAEIRQWFDERGVEFFEGLEIWHLPEMRAEFRRRTGRSPRPDRSYVAPWPVRVRRVGRRVFHAVKRRIVAAER